MRPIWSYDYWDMVGMLVDEEEWRTFRQEAQYLEKEHLETRVALRDAEAALRADPGNEELKAQVEELKSWLEELDRQAPWLTSDVPVEMALWGMPHG